MKLEDKEYRLLLSAHIAKKQRLYNEYKNAAKEYLDNSYVDDNGNFCYCLNLENKMIEKGAEFNDAMEELKNFKETNR